MNSRFILFFRHPQRLLASCQGSQFQLLPYDDQANSNERSCRSSQDSQCTLFVYELPYGMQERPLASLWWEAMQSGCTFFCSLIISLLSSFRPAILLDSSSLVTISFMQWNTKATGRNEKLKAEDVIHFTRDESTVAWLSSWYYRYARKVVLGNEHGEKLG